MAAVSITTGHRDDTLTQQQRASFRAAATRAAVMPSARVHGVWTRGNNPPWQNAHWCRYLSSGRRLAAVLEARLGRLAYRFGQDSIAWAVADTAFLRPVAEGGR